MRILNPPSCRSTRIGVGEQEGGDDRDEIDEVAQIDDAAGDRGEMAEEAEPTRSPRISRSGAQPWNRPSTIGEPATVKTKTSAAVTTKAMTWFLVSAETPAPIARKAPAISQLPI